MGSRRSCDRTQTTLHSKRATMKAWRLNKLGGQLSLETVEKPKVRAGTVLVRIEASALMSYMKPYVEGKLTAYHAPPAPFTPGGNGIGICDRQCCYPQPRMA